MKTLFKQAFAGNSHIDNTARLLRNPFSKRLSDILLSVIGLIFLSPIFILVTIMIKASDGGDIFYIQERFGKGSKKFKIVKFRTMVAAGHPISKEDYVKSQEFRVTKIGRFLRNTSIDELPQIFNVIKGDLSLVGPRPQAIPQVNYYIEHVPSYNERHMVKPGLTGLVQISDLRSEVHPDKQYQRLKLDIYYINNWSLWFDFYIIFYTFLSLWSRYKVNVATYGNNI